MMGAISVGAVALADVKRVLEPIWYEKPRVSQSVRANIESVLNYAQADGQRQADNPARWDLLKHSLPARKGARVGRHFRALACADIPALWKYLIAQETMSARCLQFTILTASRTKESTRCRWPDIDLAARIRGVEILKGGQAWQHVVPLSDQTMILLWNLLVDGKPISEWVFPARNRRGSMGQCTMRDLLERMDWLEQTTTHVIRAAFKTWATERTNYPREVAELCLSHVQGDALERAYQRGDIIEKRRQLMQAWADYCEHGEQIGANVVPLRA